jgi:hypothetical protein
MDDHDDALASGPIAGSITLGQATILNNQHVTHDVDAFVINLPENELMKHCQVNVELDGYLANFVGKLEVYRVEGKSIRSLAVPLLYLLAGKAFGISTSLQQIRAMCAPTAKLEYLRKHARTGNLWTLVRFNQCR